MVKKGLQNQHNVGYYLLISWHIKGYIYKLGLHVNTSNLQPSQL